MIDVAVLKIDAKNLPFLEIGDSDKIELGETVVAIGNPLGEFEDTLSAGIISGLSRKITAFGGPAMKATSLRGLIQTDAAINPGNSGGPLVDLEGRVIGINSATIMGAQNIGFAIPANAVKSILDSVKVHGKIVRPFLGIRYRIITPELKEANKLPVDYGILIARGASDNELAIIPGSPADKAGLAENDIILELDGVQIGGERSFASIIRGKKVGQVISLTVLHRGERKILSVTLEAMQE
jgi:S1-C subfamily serine protease